MRTLLASLIVGAAVTTTSLAARADGAQGVTYNVTVTNLTVGESFTPFLVASHRAADNLLFTPGGAPSDDLAALAEGGDTGPLQTFLDTDNRVNATTTSAGLLDPGQSVTVPITVRPGRDHISLAAMLIPTNDGFVSVQNIAPPTVVAPEPSTPPPMTPAANPTTSSVFPYPARYAAVPAVRRAQVARALFTSMAVFMASAISCRRSATGAIRSPGSSLNVHPEECATTVFRHG
jgi:hypothetical protein